MADTADLKTKQFAQVLSTVPSGVPVATQCKQLVFSVSHNPVLRGLVVGLGSLFLLLLIRPPFVLSFEYDKTRPWKGRSCLSWVSMFAVATLAAAAAVIIPWVW